MNAPVAMSIVVCFAFFANACSCVLLFFSHGAFQCPRVLCGSSARLAGIEMNWPVSESLICRGISGTVKSGTGVPFGKKVKRRTWYEHFGSSSFPPEHQSKSFQACASFCMLVIIASMGSSVCG